MRNTILTTLILIMVLQACREKEILYIQVNNAETAYHIGSTEVIAKDSPYQPMFPIRQGDLVSIDDVCFLVINGRKDRTMNAKLEENGRIYIDRKLTGIFINDKTTASLYSKIGKEDLSSLQSIALQTENNDSALSVLKEIADKNKRLNLILMNEDSLRPLSTLLRLFDPYVLATPVTNKDLPLLSEEPQMTHLLITDLDSSIQPLPRMESLTHLYVESGYELGSAFLANNPQLKDLILESDGAPELFQPLQQLSSLVLNTGSVPDMKYLDAAKLKRLTFENTDPVYAKSIAAFKNLEWVRLPEKETQSSFDSIAQSLKELQVVEFPASEKIRDVRSLSNLKYLRAVNMYGDSLIAPKGLEDLQQLKLLTFPYLHHGDSATVSRLRKALPDTTILPNDGSCLGSIWLLLLLPLAILFTFIRSTFSYGQAS